MKISKRFANVGDSSTLRITAKAKEMKLTNDIAILAAGEPDFDTPIAIKEAAIKAINDGFTGYTAVRGIKELRELIAEKFMNDNKIKYSPNNICVTSGAKQGIYNIIQSVCDEDSDVIVVSPYWVSYIEMIKMTGANPIVFDISDDNYEFHPEKLEDYITSRTRLIIINSPNNPTGIVYSKDTLIKLSEIIVKKGIYCISDEIYEKIIYPGQEHFSIASINDEIKNLTFTINGFSKAYAMTGWRIGYFAGEEKLVNTALKVQTHSTSCASSISQKAGVAALKTPAKEIEEMVSAFDNRRKYLIEKFSKFNGIDYIYPAGAFYLFVNMEKIIKSDNNDISNSEALCMKLLEEYKVATIPGSAFGSENHIRISYAASMEELEKGIDRISEFINKYYEE